MVLPWSRIIFYLVLHLIKGNCCENKRMLFLQEDDYGIKPEMFVSLAGRPSKLKKLSPEQMAIKRRKVWVSIMKKEIPKAHKQKVSNRKEVLGSLKKVSLLVQNCVHVVQS